MGRAIRGVLFALLVAAGCDDGAATLVVQVRTDLLPGQEMAAVEVSIDGEVGVTRVEASAARDWGLGVRVLERTLPRGERRLRVRAVDAAGALVVERPVRVSLDGGLRVVTVLLTRSCLGVSCPASDPAAVACLGGRCVEDRCAEEAPEGCGTPTCASAAECAPAGGSCASVECSASGTCFASPDHGACAADQVCSTALDCVAAGACVEETRQLSALGAVAGPAGPVIAFGGASMYVAATPIEGGVRVVRLDAAGAGGDALLFELDPPAAGGVAASGWSGGVHVAASDGATRIALHAADAGGTPLGSDDEVRGTLTGAFDVASTETHDAIAWTADDAGSVQQVFWRSARHGADAPLTFRLSLDGSVAVVGALAATFDELLLVYADAGSGAFDLRAARLPATGGSPRAHEAFVTGIAELHGIDAKWDGSGFGVVFADAARVQFVALDTALTVTAMRTLSATVIVPGALAITFDGTAFVVAFADGAGALHVTRVARDGTVLSPDRVVATGTGPIDASIGAITLGGAVYVAHSDGEVQLTRVCP